MWLTLSQRFRVSPCIIARMCITSIISVENISNRLHQLDSMAPGSCSIGLRVRGFSFQILCSLLVGFKMSPWLETTGHVIRMGRMTSVIIFGFWNNSISLVKAQHRQQLQHLNNLALRSRIWIFLIPVPVVLFVTRGMVVSEGWWILRRCCWRWCMIL